MFFEHISNQVMEETAKQKQKENEVNAPRQDLSIQTSSGEAKSRGQVVGRVCFKIQKKKDILAPTVLGPNLLLPAQELISPNSFYETLNKGKLSLINYKHFSFWSGKQFRQTLTKVFESICLTLACAFAENECINLKKNCVELACLFRNSR